MSYEQKVSREKPGFVFFLLDDSGSMQDVLAGTTDPRFKWVERYFGIILMELMARCNDLVGATTKIKSRYFMRTLLYGSAVQPWGNGEMDIQAAVEAFTKAGTTLGLGGKLSGTDAAAAFVQARDALQGIVTAERFRRSFPPLLFHLTDGESQTDARPIAEEIKRLATDDGNILIVNAYIGTQTNLNYQGPEDFPGYVEAADVGANPDNLGLFEMSSVMPDTIHQNLVADGIFPKLRSGSRLFFDVRTKEMLKNVLQVVGSIGSRAAK
jgi:hypothetical protein